MGFARVRISNDQWEKKYEKRSYRNLNIYSVCRQGNDQSSNVTLVVREMYLM